MDRLSVEKEARHHGSNSFPLGVYDNYKQYPQYSKRVIYLHWHDEAELIHIRRGTARVQIDDNELILREKDAAFVPHGSIHTAVSANGKDFWFDAVVFNLNLLTSGISDITQLQYINRLKLRQIQLPLCIAKNRAWGARVQGEIESIIASERGKAKGHEMAIKGSLFKIFADLISQSTETPSDSHRKHQDFDRLKIVLQYIHSNYSQKLTLDDMAGLSNFSKFYFCRFFKSAVGKTPIDYLHYHRLSRAELLLKDSNLKIIDIAYEVGFTDLSHFIRLFHKHAGVTPSQFRAKQISAI
jgi:AraC-like DNA-binding protein